MKSKTLFLKVAVILIGIPILALCIFGLPWIAQEITESNSGFPSLLYPVFLGMYVSAIPFYFALYQAFKLLSYIDRDEAFSILSVNALKHIKQCAALIGIIYGAGSPLFYVIADKTDAPGILVIGLVITFGSIVVAVFAAVLQKLLENAVEIKSENELTV